MTFSTTAIKQAAKDLDYPENIVRAVCQVEAPGGGFLKSGKPKILFEAHVFSRLTGGKYDKSHPEISSPEWNKELYVGGEAEHDRLAAAAALDRKAALQSASWGAFQVMGENYRSLGYGNIQNFVNAMYDSEDAHLESFVKFCKVNKLDDDLREFNFGTFARGYNGPGYKANKYNEKLLKAYIKFETEVVNGTKNK